MTVCIFGHVQWRWALNDRLAHGYRQATSTCNTDPGAEAWCFDLRLQEADCMDDVHLAEEVCRENVHR